MLVVLYDFFFNFQLEHFTEKMQKSLTSRVLTASASEPLVLLMTRGQCWSSLVGVQLPDLGG